MLKNEAGAKEMVRKKDAFLTWEKKENIQLLKRTESKCINVLIKSNLKDPLSPPKSGLKKNKSDLPARRGRGLVPLEAATTDDSW